MNPSVSYDPEHNPDLTAAPAVSETHPVAHVGHPDPITGEPDAHPVGVGVGALSAGAAGAAIGALAGPIGVVVGAAIGAIAGGLAGKEVAETPDETPVSTEGAPLDSFDHARGSVSAADEVPLPTNISDHTNPPDDAFFTGGTLRDGISSRTEDALDDFDRPRAAAPGTTSAAGFTDDSPLPTAISGLITPRESSFFADSATGESSILAESPFPAARAIDAKGSDTGTTQTSDHTGHLDAEHTIRAKAYYRYLDREATGQSGSEFHDWIEAEKEVLRG